MTREAPAAADEGALLRTHRSDIDRAEAAIHELIDALGFDPDAAELAATPARVARTLIQATLGGYERDPQEILSATFRGPYRDLVLVTDIFFVSMCPHHLLPFSGHAHLAYLPRDRVVGLGRVTDLVQAFACRFQFQEKLTQELADAMMDHLQPFGAACRIEATHYCERVAHEERAPSLVITEAVRGRFADDPESGDRFRRALADRRGRS
ncbi:MAG: GTP cyclohydrolase I [Candidatus Schekmanbacteria bacterium]|nr:GTP cyclohydrolase I [Candidatus Schekmanbacteria bacterium]